MSRPPRATPGGGGLVGTLVLGVVAVTLGLLCDLPFPLGPILGALGVAASAALRALAPPEWSPWTVVPAMLAASVEVLAAPYSPATLLLSGGCGLAFLYWIADDAARPAGNGRRGLVPVSIVAGVLGLAMSLVLVLPRGTSDIGVAGGLLALALALLAILLARTRLGEAPARSPG
jgi:hypothetical protein